MERLKLVLATDQESALVAHLTARALEETRRFDVIRCRISVNDISTTIRPYQPDLIMAQSALRHDEELNELVGFIRRIVRLPRGTRIATQTPRLREDQRQRLFSAGMDMWIDERLATVPMALALVAAATGGHFYSPMVMRRPAEVVQMRAFQKWVSESP